ncbi:MAG: hypothetical protein EH225_01385 [Calditrichaeota bacterium]|nr:hypothetical protein [Calditrichota bacterium]RQV92780.1 MAG: hypothetical protein EH221_10885 [bacterium]RQW07651.1 MAG: hypothetical protein EH225_01385 [Calditrichota bacterium]
MKRIHLFEFEDYPWFSGTIRELVTDYLHYIVTTFHMYRPVIPLLKKALKSQRFNTIIDIGSGGSGPIPDILTELHKENLGDVQIVLSDMYPHLDAFQKIQKQAPDQITYIPHSVDARSIPEKLVGFITFFNTFHHFKPADAVKILQNASRGGNGIGIFELAGRDPITLFYIFMSPVISCLITPFIKPRKWKRWIFTYLLPAVPFIIWWDGMVSSFRTYSTEELVKLMRETGNKDYVWKAGRIRGVLATKITYLIGYSKI